MSVGGNFLASGLLNDVSGKYINIINGRRVTTNTPDDVQGKILIFGGSTIFCQEVPDNLTVPSLVQSYLNKNSSISYQVFNFGVPSFHSGQQLELLKEVKIYDDDVIIFFDGINDVYYPIFFGYKNGLQPGMESFRPAIKLNSFGNFLFNASVKFEDKSSTFKLLKQLLLDNPSGGVTNREEFQINLKLALQSYRKSIIAANQIANSNGATFLHFLQPHIFNDHILTDWETEITTNPFETPPAMKETLLVAYPHLKEMVVDLQLHGVNSTDLTNIFDAPSRKYEIFLDFAHVNHVGNEIISNKISSHIIDIHN